MKDLSGFTLIEILVVMSIVLLLSSIALLGFQRARETARDNRRENDFNQLQQALQLYYYDYGEYPPNPEPGNACYIPEANCLTQLVDNGYIAELPQDPLQTGSGPGYVYGYYDYGSWRGAVLQYDAEAQTDFDADDCDSPTGNWCEKEREHSYCICFDY